MVLVLMGIIIASAGIAAEYGLNAGMIVGGGLLLLVGIFTALIQYLDKHTES